MSNPIITAVFSDDLSECDVTIDGHVYHNLRVKKQNLRDWQEPQMTYSVRIPCKAALGQDYMLCAGRDYVYGYIHNERTELVFHALSDDDEIMDLPQRKKSKKKADYQQMLLFEAAEAAARGGEAS